MRSTDRWSAIAIAFVSVRAKNVLAATSSTTTDVGSIILQGLAPFETNNTTSSGPSTTQSIPATITGVVGSTFVSARDARPTDGFVWSTSDGVTDLSTAQQCFTDIVSWRVSSIAWFNANVGNRTWPQTISTSTTTQLWETSTTIYPTNASIYTLCDHSPRADVKPVTAHSSWNTTLSFTYTQAATPTYSISQPCAPNNHMCRLWYYESNLLDSADGELMSNCGLPAHMDPVHKPCLIGGGPVRLIYTPVTTQGGNLCAHNGTTIAANTTMAPITALGTIFDPGSVYVSFSTLFAYYDGFGYNDTVGPTFTNHIVALSSAAISTHCGGWFAASGPGTAMNYADLNWPVAASAYKCQARCNLPEQLTSCDLDGCHLNTVPHHPGCQTIWSDVDPILALPTDVSKMVPAWSTCSAWDESLPNFWFDPPIALQPAATIARPTVLPGPGDGQETTSTPAAPAQTPTALPEITAAPTTWGNSPAESGQAGGNGEGQGDDQGDGQGDNNEDGESDQQDGDQTSAVQAGETMQTAGNGGGTHDSPAGPSVGSNSGTSDVAQTTDIPQSDSADGSMDGQTSTAQASATDGAPASQQADTSSGSSQPSRAVSTPSSAVFTGGAASSNWHTRSIACLISTIVLSSAFMLV